MTKKRSVGVIVFVILFLGLTLLWTYNIFTIRYPLLYTYLAVFITLLTFVTSIGLFMLKEWGRKLALGLGIYVALKASSCALVGVTSWVVTLTSLVFIYALIFLLWWYFTRSKVKEQFK